MRNVVDFLTGNLILNLSILAWAIAQVLKTIVVLVTQHRWVWRYILSSGGMPSSHSATVCALASSIAALYGFSSPMFAVAAILAFVVMYDAFNVRRETGEQAKVLNYMMDNWTGEGDELLAKDLKELIGHTPLQVLMGALLGVTVGWGGVWFWTR